MNIINNLQNLAYHIPREYQIIYLDDIEFMGDTRTHKIIINMWNSNASIKEIAKALKENIDKTFIILFHLARIGEIRPRGKQGIWGDLI